MYQLRMQIKGMPEPSIVESNDVLVLERIMCPERLKDTLLDAELFIYCTVHGWQPEANYDCAICQDELERESIEAYWDAVDMQVHHEEVYNG